MSVVIFSYNGYKYVIFFYFFTINFYFIKIYDETKLLINYEDYANDISLKGEFIRLVQASDLSEEEIAQVIDIYKQFIKAKTAGLQKQMEEDEEVKNALKRVYKNYIKNA